MTDISNLNLSEASKAGAFVDLVAPGTGTDLGIKIGVIGYDSEAVKEAERAYLRQMQDRKKKADASEFLTGRRVAVAAAAVASVEGMEIGKEAVTVDKLRSMLAEPAWVWILEQIEEVAGDRASFFKSAGKP
ncbi:hypothetical protein ACRARG_04535 [Pseudooceanicola sp. C21-150M6]|uniref:hypothetical protein n=1 Tax=Pseudooceanicola sp. C21-150M6 TaxID=3434355 RepID=UPI003D7F63FB